MKKMTIAMASLKKYKRPNTCAIVILEAVEKAKNVRSLFK
jgi:hypothetical protein